MWCTHCRKDDRSDAHCWCTRTVPHAPGYVVGPLILELRARAPVKVTPVAGAARVVFVHSTITAEELTSRSPSTALHRLYRGEVGQIDGRVNIVVK